MPRAEDIEACKDAVVGYCTAINDWETAQTIVDRIAKGQHVIGSQGKAVQGITPESHREKHADIFNRFVFPRDRGYGSNPGAPNSWGSNGSFFNVAHETIESIDLPSHDRAEVITNWGYQLPGGRTMFVLKCLNGSWLIDSLKVDSTDGWEDAYL